MARLPCTSFVLNEDTVTYGDLSVVLQSQRPQNDYSRFVPSPSSLIEKFDGDMRKVYYRRNSARRETVQKPTSDTN